MAREIKAIEWTGADQYTLDYGTLRKGETIVLGERGIPQDAAESWIRDGWAVDVKQTKPAEKAKEV